MAPSLLEAVAALTARLVTHSITPHPAGVESLPAATSPCRPPPHACASAPAASGPSCSARPALEAIATAPTTAPAPPDGTLSGAPDSATSGRSPVADAMPIGRRATAPGVDRM